MTVEKQQWINDITNEMSEYKKITISSERMSALKSIPSQINENIVKKPLLYLAAALAIVLLTINYNAVASSDANSNTTESTFSYLNNL